ncbi:MAG: alpha-1,3-fucosyl transferase, partial [Clostridia bacterium]|nr:alpha-1,3-fucosyl transferase [Clostridia bacterium]
FFTGEDISPDFNFCDYAIAFDRISFGDRYLRFPHFAYRDEFPVSVEKHHITEDDLARKTKFCNFIYSNSNASKTRENFFRLLSEYKHVDSGGRYLNNIGGPVADKLEFQKDYKFSIAFENDSSLDYTTEKIMDAFAAKTIPIYWGNKNIANDFNPKSFINCHDYDSFEQVVERVKEIDNDPELFRSILAEPIFKDEKIPYELSMDCLRDYLFHIFDQPLEEAKRRSSFSWRMQYVDSMRRMVKFYYKIFHSSFVRGLYKIYVKLTNK